MEPEIVVRIQIESRVVVPGCLAGEGKAITTSRHAARVTFLIGIGAAVLETMASLCSRYGFIRLG